MTPADLRAALTALGYTLDQKGGRRVYQRCPTCGQPTHEAEEASLRAEDAARALGTTYTTLWSWLTGHRKRGVPAWVPLKLRELEEQLRARRVVAAALAVRPMPQEKTLETENNA